MFEPTDQQIEALAIERYNAAWGEGPGREAWDADTNHLGKEVWVDELRDFFSDYPAFQAIIRAAQCEAWDECAKAAAWCADNGPADAIAPYLAEHNPYRESADV